MTFPKVDNNMLNTGNTAGQLVKLDSLGKLPPLDASQLLNLPSSGGVGFALLDTQVANNLAQVDFTSGITNAYKEYVIRGTDINVSTSAGLGFRVRVAGVFRIGSEYTYGGNGTSNQQGILGISNANGTEYIIIPTSFMPIDVNGNVSFELSISNPTGTSRTKAIRSNAGGSAQDYNAGFACQGGGRWFGASTSPPLNYSALDGFRILPTNGLVTGTFKLYGVP